MTVSMNTVSNQEQNCYKKPGTGAVIGGLIAGSFVHGLADMPHSIGAPIIMARAAMLSNSLNKDEFSQVEKAVKETIKRSGLEDKGVSIIKTTAENKDEVAKIVQKEIDNSPLKYLPKGLKDSLGKKIYSQMTSGQNACYTFASKKILMPEKELCLALFHETGHAMNANLSNIGKALQKCRIATALGLPIALIALLKNKKAEGEKPKNDLDKTTTFIKNNAGKLTFATFIPMLLEEGLATAKGNKFAKEILSSNLAEKVVRTNSLGFMTYLLLATTSSLGIYLGTKVKDSIARNKIADED